MVLDFEPLLQLLAQAVADEPRQRLALTNGVAGAEYTDADFDKELLDMEAAAAVS